MIVDTSALIAILRDEPEALSCAHAIENSAVRPALEPNFSPLVVDSISLDPFGLTWLILVECVF